MLDSKYWLFLIDIYTNDHIATAVAAATAEHAKHATMTEDIKKGFTPQGRRSVLPWRAIVALGSLFYYYQHFGNYDHADATTTIRGEHWRVGHRGSFPAVLVSAYEAALRGYEEDSETHDKGSY